MPGSQRRQGEEGFDGARNGNTAQGLESIADDHCAVPGIEKSDMAWCVSWRGNHFEGADTISFVQQERRLRFADGIAAAQAYLRLGEVQALIAGQTKRASLADISLGLRQRGMRC